MAQNIVFRITNNESETKYFYWPVSAGNSISVNGSAFAFLGSASAGSTLTSSVYSYSDLGFSGHSKKYVFSANQELSLGSGNNNWNNFYLINGAETPSQRLDSAGLYGVNSLGYSPSVVSSSAQQAYFLDITRPAGCVSGSGATASVADGKQNWGTWSQYDSSNNLLDTTNPTPISANFSGSSNSHISLVFSESPRNSSGELYTTSNFLSVSTDSNSSSPAPGKFRLEDSNDNLKNPSIESVSYSTTTVENDTLTIGFSFDGSITSGSTLSLTFNDDHFHDPAGNKLTGLGGGSTWFTGSIPFPSTGTSSFTRTYIDRTFNIVNATTSSAYAYAKVDEDEGDGGYSSEYKFLGEISAASTGSFTIPGIEINDNDYGSGMTRSTRSIYASHISSSLDGTWSPNNNLGSSNYAELNFDGGNNSDAGPLTDSRVTFSTTYTDATTFSDWVIQDTGSNVVDYQVNSMTVSLASQSAGSGVIKLDFGERVRSPQMEDSGYGFFSEATPSSASDLIDFTSASFALSIDSSATGSITSVTLGSLSYADSSNGTTSGSILLSFTYEGTPDGTEKLELGTNNNYPATWATTFYDDSLNSRTFYSQFTEKTTWPSASSTSFSSGRIVMSSESGATASETSAVDSSGGSITTTGGTLTIPSSALSSEVTIGMDVSDSGSASTGSAIMVANDPEAEVYSPVISLTPHGQTFSSAVTVQFDLIGSAAGTCPSDLKIYKRDSATGKWYLVPSNLYSCDSGTITISTTKFSQYQAIGGSGIMALTQLSEKQLEKLVSANQALGSAIDITGSTALTADMDDAFVMMIQEGDGSVAKKVSAGTLQNYFSNLDISNIDGIDESFQLIFRSGTAGAIAYDSDGITWNPSSDTLSLTNLSAAGTIIGSSTIQIEGAADLNGALDVAGATSLAASGVATDIRGTLSVDEAAVFDATIRVEGTSDFNGGLDVAGATSLAASGVATDIRGTLSVDEAAVFDATVQIVGNADLDGGLDVAAATSLAATGLLTDIRGTLSVDEAAVFDSSIQVEGTSDFNGGLDVAGATSLAASGVATDIRGTLSVDEAAVFDATVQIVGNADLDGGLDVYGAAAFDSTVQIGGNADLNGELDVAGAVSLGAVGVDTTVRGDLSVNENLTITGNLTVQGSTVTVDAENLAIEDQQIELNRTGSSATAIGGGIKLNRDDADDLQILWSGTEWQLIDANSAYQNLHISTLDADGGADIAGATSLAASGVATDIRGTLSVDEAAVFDATVQIEGSADLNGGLDVAGATNLAASGVATDIRGTLSVDESAVFDATVQIEGAADLNGALDVAGATSLAASGVLTDIRGTLSVDEAAVFDATIRVEGTSDFNGGLDVAGATSLAASGVLTDIRGTLSVDEAAVFDSSIQVEGTSDFNGGLDVAGATSLAATGVLTDIRGTLSVDEAAVFDATIQAAGNADLNGALDVAGATSLAATGVLTDIRGTLSVDEAAVFDATVQIEGSADLNGGLDVAGATSLAASGVATDIRGTLSVDEAAVFDATVQIEGSADLNGGLDVASTTSLAASGVLTDIRGTLSVDEAAVFDATVQIEGNADLNGGLDVAGAATFGAGITFSSGLSALNSSSIEASDSLVALDGGTDGAMITVAELGKYLADSADTNGIQVDGTSGQFSIEPISDFVSGSAALSGPEGGAQLTASLSQVPVQGSIQVYLNGLLQTPSGSGVNVFDYHYTASAPQNICFVAGAVEENDVISIRYIKK